MVDNLLNLNNLWLHDNLRISQVNFLNYSDFWSLDDGFLHNLSHTYNTLLEEWNLHNSLNLLDNFTSLDHWTISDNFNLSNLFLHDNLLPDNWHFIRLPDNSISLHNSLDNLWHFDKFLNSLDDWNWLLDYSVHNLVSDFNMVLDLFSVSVLDLRHDLLDDFLNLDHLWDLDDFLNDFLHNDWNLNDFLDNLGLRVDDDLFDDLDFSDLDLHMVDDLLNLDHSLNLYNLLDNFFHCHYFRHLLNDFNNSLNNLWHFNNPFHNFLNGHNFLHNISNNNWHFQRHVDNSFNLPDFLNLNNFFGNLFHSNNLGHFDNPLHNFLDNFFHFHNFGDNSKHFQDIIHINNTHNLLSNHTNNTLVHFQNNTSPDSNLL